MRDISAVLLGILIGVVVSAYKDPAPANPEGFVMEDARATYVRILPYVTYTPTPFTNVNGE